MIDARDVPIFSDQTLTVWEKRKFKTLIEEKCNFAEVTIRILFIHIFMQMHSFENLKQFKNLDGKLFLDIVYIYIIYLYICILYLDIHFMKYFLCSFAL